MGLAVCYGSAAPTAERIDEWREAFFALAGATTLDTSEVDWVEDTRYSPRQDRRHPVSGLTGRVHLHGPAQAWHTVLQPLEALHLGKQTALGLGRLRLSDGDGEVSD